MTKKEYWYKINMQAKHKRGPLSFGFILQGSVSDQDKLGQVGVKAIYLRYPNTKQGPSRLRELAK
jgi:hypothetical protein